MTDNSDLELSLAETMQVISLDDFNTPAEYSLAAGDGCQIKAKSAVDIAKLNANNNKTDAELSMGDHADLEAKPSNRSTFSTSELEQRWKLRLQKLAEFENKEAERAESSGANGDEIETKPKTWQEFWQDVQHESSRSSE